MSKYGNGGKPGPASKCKAGVPPNWCSGYYLAGMVSASVMVDALKSAGKNLSRKSLMKGVLHLNIKNNPFVLPGITIKTADRPLADLEQAQFQRWHKGRWYPSSLSPRRGSSPGRPVRQLEPVVLGLRAGKLFRGRVLAAESAHILHVKSP